MNKCIDNNIWRSPSHPTRGAPSSWAFVWIAMGFLVKKHPRGADFETYCWEYKGYPSKKDLRSTYLFIQLLE